MKRNPVKTDSVKEQPNDDNEQVALDVDDSTTVLEEPEEPDEPANTRYRSFGLPMHLACGSSGARSCIQFKNGFMNATDGNMILHISMADLGFPDDVIKELNGYYLHKEAFKHIWNKDCELVAGVLISIEGIDAPLVDSTRFNEEEVVEHNYPDIEGWIKNTGKEKPIGLFGLNGNLAKAFFSIFRKKELKVSFSVAAADSFQIKVKFIGWEQSVAYLAPFILGEIG